MRYRKLLKCVFITLIVCIMSGCISSNGSKSELSDEQQAQLYLKMGARYLEMGMLKTAKENLEKAEAIDSNNASIQNSLGALYEQMKMFSDAKKHYQNAVELDKESYSAKNNYGRFLCERGDYEAGMQLLKDALLVPLNNRKWFAYTNIGRCELRKGKTKEAENNLRHALQLNKHYAPALFEMQKISYHSEKYMSARAFLQRYLAVDEHSAETLWYAVQTERLLGNMKAAEDYKDKLFSLFPLSKQARQLKIK